MILFILITVAISLSYAYWQFNKVQKDLNIAGTNCFSLTYTDNTDSLILDNIVPTEDELLKLADAHYRKIDLSDGIYVVNMDGYIGTSVKKEIEYAERHGKEVLYHYNQ